MALIYKSPVQFTCQTLSLGESNAVPGGSPCCEVRSLDLGSEGPLSTVPKC